MTSKERVLTTFAHKEPDHVPCWLGASPEWKELARAYLKLEDDEALLRYIGDDFRRVFSTYAGPPERSPDQQLSSPEVTWRSPFDIVHAVMKYASDYYLEVSRRIFEASGDAIDIFFIGNDFGAQTGPLLSPDLFREFILPQLKRFVDLGHHFGKLVILHTDGAMRLLIPDLIAIGLDGMQSVQPLATGMELGGLKRDFGDDFSLFGCVDSQARIGSGGRTSDPAKQEAYTNVLRTQWTEVLSRHRDNIMELWFDGRRFSLSVTMGVALTSGRATSTP